MAYNDPPDLTWTYERLNKDFEARFDALGGKFDAGFTSTHLDAEATFDGSKGPVWIARVQYAKAQDALGRGPYEPVMPVEEALHLLTHQIEDLLQHLGALAPGKAWDGRDVISLRDQERLKAELTEARAAGDKARADVLRTGLKMFGVTVDLAASDNSS